MSNDINSSSSVLGRHVTALPACGGETNTLAMCMGACEFV